MNFVSDGINFVGRVSENNGIKGKIAKQNFEPNEENTITATVIGNYKYVKFQEEPYYCSQNINKLVPNFKINKRIAHYIITHIQKFVSKYNNQQGGYKLPELQNHKISLPTNPDGSINFDYMETFMKELEEGKILDLSTYLKASGLDNYNLNKDEIEAINNHKNIQTKTFKISELFDIHPTKSYGLTNKKLFETSGNIPVVVNSSTNNGIGGYINLKPTEKGNIITYSDTTSDNAIFYQPDDFIGYSHVQGLYSITKLEWDELSLLYFLTLFKKCAKGKFDYATKFNRALASEMVVELPIKDNQIDFDYIKNFINALKKLTIKNVIEWKDKVINAIVI